jgi:hypothetical protein
MEVSLLAAVSSTMSHEGLTAEEVGCKGVQCHVHMGTEFHSAVQS